MDIRTGGCTDSPCILQDFVPFGSLRGRCPKRIYVVLRFYLFAFRSQKLDPVFHQNWVT